MRISATSSSRQISGKRDTRGGFTLMEVVLAMAIIGLLAALGMPYMRPHAGVAALRVKTFEIATLLRFDRNAALRSGSISTVLVNADKRIIQSALTQSGIVIPASMSLDLTPEGQRGVVFYPDGRSSGARISISSGDTTFVIDVNGVTAAIDTSSVLP